MKEVKLSTEISEIGANCFADCSSLEKIYNLGLARSTTIGSGFLSGVILENNTIAASATAMDANALVDCNTPEWNLPNISIGELLDKNRFGAPEGTAFKCADGKTTKYGENTMIWFDDRTCIGVKASGNYLTRDDLVSAGVMTSEYEWNKQPTRVVVADGLSGFGNAVFANCQKLSIVDMYSVGNVGERVFANCTSLKEISGSRVTDYGFDDVGSYAFQGCTNLSRIKLNTSNIHEGAFEGCVALSSVSFDYPSGGIIIESKAFAGCVGLKSITVPSTTTEIHDEAFAGSGLVTANIKSSAVLTSNQWYNPGSGIFKNCTNLTKVTLPSSGCEIPNECFMNCNKLQIAYDLYKCTDIGDYAFFGCSALTNNDVGKCNSIGDSAFQGCSAITQMKLKSGAVVGNYSFMGCGNISVIYDLYNANSIGDNALSGLNFPRNNTIRALDSGLTSKSLSGCLNESWYLPNIYKFEAEAKNWYGATYGTTLKCKDGTTVSDNQDDVFTTINGTDKVLLKGVVDKSALEDAGYDPSSIVTIVFGTGVTGIGDWAFVGCSGLKSVVIPESVTSIGQYAFDGCSGLTNVTIGNNVTSIGLAAFYYCNNLSSVTIGNSVTNIGDYAFLGCDGLTNVTIPNSVTSIGSSTFSACSGLMSFVVGDGNPNYKSVNRLLLSKDGTLLVAGVNGDVTISDGVTSIGDWAFSSRNELTNVIIPDSVTNIGEAAFSGCTGLTGVTIPNSVANIGRDAFLGCSGLTSVTIPESVTSIGDGAFYYCDKLTSLTFLGKTLAQVQGMANYSWGVYPSIIHVG